MWRVAAQVRILVLASVWALALILAAAGAVMARVTLDPHDLVGHGGPVKAIAISPDGNEAITGSFDYSMLLWRLGKRPQVEKRFFEHDAAVNAVAFTPDGKRAVTGSDDETVGVLGLASGRLLARFRGHHLKVVSVAVSPDGRLAASASFDGTARLWHLDSLTAGPVLSGHHGPVNAVAFTSGGAEVLTAGYDGTLRLWRASDGAPERIIYKHGWGINVISPLSGGAEVLFGAVDGTVGLVDLKSGDVTGVIARRQRPVLALVLNRDGTLAAAGGGDGLVEVYDTATWRPLRSLDNPYGPVWALAFTVANNALYMGGLDDQPHYWQFLPGRAFEAPKGKYPRRFQVSEASSPGELQFLRKCSICHTLTRNGGNRAGPTLYGIFGRRAGSVNGYVYSPALAKSGIVWSAKTITRLFTEGPEHYIPGTKMPLQKMKSAGERAALLSYLKKATAASGQDP